MHFSQQKMFQQSQLQFQNGFVSALPHLVCWIVSTLFAILSDWLISSKKLSLAATRGLMSGLAIYGMSGAILGIAFTGCNPTLAVVWLVIAFVFDGSFIAGFAVNQMELSPNYAGSIRGIVSTFSNMNGFLTPLVAAYFVDGNVRYEYYRFTID